MFLELKLTEFIFNTKLNVFRNLYSILLNLNLQIVCFEKYYSLFKCIKKTNKQIYTYVERQNNLEEDIFLFNFLKKWYFIVVPILFVWLDSYLKDLEG